MISSSRYCIFKSFFQQLEFLFKPKDSILASPNKKIRTIVHTKTVISITRSDLNLKQIWNNLQTIYFPERSDLSEYKIVWSNKKQTRSLASCCLRKKIVRVARQMSFAESAPYLEALIYHEMCHAVLGPPKIINRRRIMHGKDFKSLERVHPGIKSLDHWIKAGGWTQVTRKDLRQRKANSFRA